MYLPVYNCAICNEANPLQHLPASELLFIFSTSFCPSGPFTLTDATQLECPLLYECFICISLIAFICPFLHYSLFVLVLDFLLFSSFNRECEYRKSLIFILFL